MGWNGVGLGVVSVTEPSDGVLLFDEVGIWSPVTGHESTFTNVFRWSRLGEALRLEHIRYGPEQPVFLFELVPDNAGVWREVSPHICREDCYAATMTVAGTTLQVKWNVNGPRKQASIRYDYT